MLSFNMRSSVRNIQYIGSRNETAGVGVTSKAFTYPAGTVPGDLLIAIICNDAQGTGYTAPSGWTEVLDTAGRHISYRTAEAGSSGSTTATWTLPGSQNLTRCYMICYRNAAWDLLGTYPSAGTSPTSTASAITLTKNESALILFISSTNPSPTFSTPTGFTVLEVNEGTGVDPGMKVYHKLRTASGSSGSVNVTVNTNARAVLLGVKPTTIG